MEISPLKFVSIFFIIDCSYVTATALHVEKLKVNVGTLVSTFS